jgi:hypothetical protein
VVDGGVSIATDEQAPVQPAGHRWVDRVGTWWDRAPRPRELLHPARYLAGQRLFGELHTNGHTMLSARRGRTLYRLAVRVTQAGIPGAVVDCGAWNEGSTALLAAGAPDRDASAFDSFRGLPKPAALDGDARVNWGGELRGSSDRVRAAVEAPCTDRAPLHLQGLVREDLPQRP